MNSWIRIALGMAVASASFHAAATDAVQLLKVESVVDGHNGAHAQFPRFDVVVANWAFDKNVAIHLKRHDGTWVDVPLAFSRPAGEGRELWTGMYFNQNPDSTLPPNWDPEFAVRYTVNGQTVWDNNGGQNYRIGRNDGTVLFDKVVHDGNYRPVSFRTPAFQGWATVRNLGPAKQVRVFYSTDNWRTTRTADASFNPRFWTFAPDGRRSSAANPNVHGFEEWSYQLDVGNAPAVEYAIQYTVNGEVHWDNNFGRNYVTRFE